MQMRISCHFLADLHVRRRAWNRSEKRIRNTLSKPCRVELVTSRNRDYRPLAISEHSFFYIYTIENSPMDLSRHRRILSNVSRGEKLREVWIIVEGSRPRKIDFPRTRNYLHRFSKYIKWLFARQCIWFISLVILVNEGDSSRPAPTRVHVPLDTVFNQIW